MDNFRKVVQPRTAAQIEAFAANTRRDLGLGPDDRVSMLNIIEEVLPELIDGYNYRVVENGAIGGAEAITDMFAPLITFSERTYDGLYRGNVRYRMTAAHELGHLLLHSRRPVSLAFGGERDPLIDPERQADLFAAAFLMPLIAFRRCRSISEAMAKFDVSRDAATCRARRLGLKHLVYGPQPNFAKKGRK